MFVYMDQLGENLTSTVQGMSLNVMFVYMDQLGEKPYLHCLGYEPQCHVCLHGSAG